MHLYISGTWKIINNQSGENCIFQEVKGVTRAASARQMEVPKRTNPPGFAFNGAKIWNRAPKEIRVTETLNSVKPKIQAFARTFQ